MVVYRLNLGYADIKAPSGLVVVPVKTLM